MIEIHNIKLPIDKNINFLEQTIVKKLHLSKVPEYTILKRSIDARKKPDIYYIYKIGVTLKNSKCEAALVKRINKKNVILTRPVKYSFIEEVKEKLTTDNNAINLKHHPLIVGAGPAGLFCAYILASCGLQPVIVERGLMVEDRINKVNDFWNGKGLDPECNVQFGEGGAGTFSDGKLNTQVKDKYGRIRFVLEEFVKHGADLSILYDNKPHIGTDVLTKVVIGIRKEIEDLGGTFLFDTKLSEICIDNIVNSSNLCDKLQDNSNSAYPINERTRRIMKVLLTHNGADTCVETDNLVLAIGHSARDTFSMLYDKEVPLSAKDFAMGVRIEHPESVIRKAMYGQGKAALKMPTPPYKLTYKTKSGRGVYSFCMCPGGYVVNASSENGFTAVNGMSYSGRNGENSNSALIVTVKKEDFNSDSPLAGVVLQRKLEKAVYEQGQGRIVVQRLEDFKKGIPTDDIGTIKPQTKGEYVCGNVAKCIPDYISDSIIEAIPSFEKEIPGFDDNDAIISGVESRTSSPVRIIRDKDYQSINIGGLYPCGEGAGYAGGIMSAAMDGMKVAEAIIQKALRN